MVSVEYANCILTPIHNRTRALRTHFTSFTFVGFRVRLLLLLAGAANAKYTRRSRVAMFENYVVCVSES